MQQPGTQQKGWGGGVQNSETGAKVRPYLNRTNKREYTEMVRTTPVERNMILDFKNVDTLDSGGAHL